MNAMVQGSAAAGMMVQAPVPESSTHTEVSSPGSMDQGRLSKLCSSARLSCGRPDFDTQMPGSQQSFSSPQITGKYAILLRAERRYDGKALVIYISRGSRGAPKKSQKRCMHVHDSNMNFSFPTTSNALRVIDEALRSLWKYDLKRVPTCL